MLSCGQFTMELNSFALRRLGVSLVTRGISSKRVILPPRGHTETYVAWSPEAPGDRAGFSPGGNENTVSQVPTMPPVPGPC